MRFPLVAALGMFLAVGPARLYLQAQSFVDPGEHLTAATVRLVLRSTSWGTGWMVQLMMAALAAIICFRPARSPRASRSTVWSTAVGLAAAFSTPLTGHAVAGPWPPAIQVFVQGVHVLGGGVWLGTLLALMVIGFRTTRGLDREARAEAVSQLVQRFSPLALAGAATLVLAGSIMSWLYLRSIPALWQTVYGRTLLVKLAVLVAVLAHGAFNWRRVKPTLSSPAGTEMLRRSAGLELVLGALLLAVTAVLVALPTPHM